MIRSARRAPRTISMEALGPELVPRISGRAADIRSTTRTQQHELLEATDRMHGRPRRTCRAGADAEARRRTPVHATSTPSARDDDGRR